ncbi:putative periplasmic or secreted lipoprotein [Cupriavidus gilardii J11]|uniref:Putative periplasmic or secreted lipoprotein n=1 Tax=Cupriavidus gilardii J11 TaxID=936133 RepID=A0A562B973_9BURK|nr:BON domain-containing protein [Cupriavidus gilardii]TWG81737.1 putative periplasmic or secreted lipoprotein [Cupriavidus gilardii J11]
MRNEYNPRRQQSSWPGYDQRDDGWSDNRSERWAQDDWMAESEGDTWESARRRSELDPWQLSEGGPSREALRYGSETEGTRASGSPYPRGDDARRYEREYDRGWDMWSEAGRHGGYGQQGRVGGEYGGTGGYTGASGYGDYGGYGRSQDLSRDPYRDPARQPYRGASAASEYGPSSYGQASRYGDRGPYGQFGEDEWSTRASGRGDAASGYDYASEYDDDGREHGPLYRLGRRIGEAVGNLFGDDDETGHYPRTGPKGYRRSDERIREAVCERLAYAEGIDVSDVSIEVEGGVVKLSGTVAHRRQKYDIEDMVEREFGVTDVQNDIRVRRNERTGASEEMTDVRNWSSDWT